MKKDAEKAAKKAAKKKDSKENSEEKDANSFYAGFSEAAIKMEQVGFGIIILYLCFDFS